SVVSGRSIDEIAQNKRRRVWQSNRGGSKQSTVAPAPRAALQTAPTRAGKATSRAPRRTATKAAAKKQAKRKRKGDDVDGGAPLPAFVPPSLATLRETAPNGPQWLHEVKFDGYRIQARLDRGAVRLLTRKGLDWTEKFPNVARAVAALPARSALVD